MIKRTKKIKNQASSISPILVRTFGRTGSTLLMQILGTNDKILFERNYPFETRYLSYVYQMARMVELRPTANKNWNANSVFQGKENFVAQLPYANIKMLDKKKLSGELFVSLWEQFSKNMRETTGIGRDELCFYAEKVPHKVADVATNILDGRNMYLLRDPRDEMVSIKSFNAKRGFNSFGWSKDDTDETYAKRMCQRRRVFMQDILNSEPQYNRLNVRYEDLIRHGQSEVKRISDWLGLPLSLTRATTDQEIKDRHMTAENYDSTVERWKNELTDDIKEIFFVEIGSELSELGYST